MESLLEGIELTFLIRIGPIWELLVDVILCMETLAASSLELTFMTHQAHILLLQDRLLRVTPRRVKLFTRTLKLQHQI